jgi:hypothetical protein
LRTRLTQQLLRQPPRNEAGYGAQDAAGCNTKGARESSRIAAIRPKASLNLGRSKQNWTYTSLARNLSFVLTRTNRVERGTHKRRALGARDWRMLDFLRKMPKFEAMPRTVFGTRCIGLELPGQLLERVFGRHSATSDRSDRLNLISRANTQVFRGENQLCVRTTFRDCLPEAITWEGNPWINADAVRL